MNNRTDALVLKQITIPAVVPVGAVSSAALAEL
jgi:hypothetical protein